MKKLISLLLSLAMLCSIAAVPGYASERATDWDGDPVIFIQGYTGSPLIKDKGLETEETVLGTNSEFDINKIILSLPGIIFGIITYAINGDSDLLVKSFGELAGEKLDNMSCLPDGSSKHNITTYPYYAEEASAAALTASGNEAYIPEAGITDEIRKTVPDEYFFVFNSDWRMGQIDNSERLDWFIGEVLRITGKDKADIYALSHGGQLAATYLYYHGTEGEVDNAVLNVPAIGGTTIVTGLLGSDSVSFDMNELARFLSVMLHTETDLRWLGKILPADFLNGLLMTAFNEVFLPYAIYFGSVWDFMNIETYTALKEKYLNPLLSNDLIVKADKMHYDCMANMGEGLRKAQAAGVSISIMSNYGTRLGTGEQVDSDFVIDTACTSGAYVAPYGETFADNYSQKNTVCTDKTHNHISPTRTVDVSCGYLPENTWFIQGQYHGQAAADSYSLDLLLKLLLTDELSDVHSDPSYPQFELGQNPIDAVYAKFTNELSGRFNSNSNTLLIRNLSEEYSITVRSITAEGCEFENDSTAVIAPGEETLIPCTGIADEDCIAVEITYKRQNAPLTPAFTKSFYFTAA